MGPRLARCREASLCWSRTWHFTYGDLKERTSRSADVLDRLGMTAGDWGLVLLERIPEPYFIVLGTSAHRGGFAAVLSFLGPEQVDVYAWPLGRSGNHRVALHFTDITGRKMAEDELRYRSEQFRGLIQQAPIGVYLVDADFRIVEVNPAARPSFGDIPELIGRDDEEVVRILWPPEID